MPTQPESHHLRQVAESFGVDAARYDRTRPPYPAELLERLITATPAPASGGPAAPASGGPAAGSGGPQAGRNGSEGGPGGSGDAAGGVAGHADKPGAWPRAGAG